MKANTSDVKPVKQVKSRINYGNFNVPFGNLILNLLKNLVKNFMLFMSETEQLMPA